MASGAPAAGARSETTFWQAAGLGLLDRVKEHCAGQPPPSQDEITNAFWNACRGGQRATAEFLMGRGADLNWIGHSRKTPLDASRESANQDLIAWLLGMGAKRADELKSM